MEPGVIRPTRMPERCDGGGLEQEGSRVITKTAWSQLAVTGLQSRPGARDCTAQRKNDEFKILFSTHLGEFSTIVGSSDRLGLHFRVHFYLASDLGAFNYRDAWGE